MSVFDDQPEAPASVATSLSTLVDQYGPMLFNDPPRLKLLLVQSHPDATITIDAVLAALDAEVPQRLMAMHDDAAIATLLPRMADQVAQRDGVSYKAAVQAVRAWALALALPDDGLDDRAPMKERTVKAAVDFASVVTPLATRAPVESIAPPAEDPLRSDAFADTVISTRFMPAAPDETPSVAATEFVPLPLSPLPPAHGGDAPPVSAGAADYAMHSAAPGAPERVIHPSLHYPAGPQPSRRRGRVLSALALAAIVIVAGLAWRAWQEMPTAAPAGPNVATSKTDPAPAIADRTESQVAAPDPQPPTAPPATSADANSLAAAPPADVPPPVVARAANAAPQAVVTPSPAATVGTTGPPLTITRIEVPRVTGDQPFAVRLVVSGPVDQVVAVEERYVDRASGRIASRTVPTRTLKPAAAGIITVPVRALAGGDRSSMDFLLVDRGGMRSAPKRVAFDVIATPDGGRGETRTATLGIGAGTAADGSTGCTPATCGVVIESRAIDGSASLYLIVVMNDARESSSFSAPYRLQSGTRVRLSGGRVLPIASPP